MQLQWQEPSSLSYWDGPVDWSKFERNQFPSPAGEVKLEVRKGLFRKVNRVPTPAISVDEANCLRISVRQPWEKKGSDQFFLIRPRNEEEEIAGVAKEILQLSSGEQDNSPLGEWRKDYASLLQEKKRILGQVCPGATDYVFFRMMGEWHVQYSCHFEVQEIPELGKLEQELKALRDRHPGSSKSGLAGFDDLLGDRCF